MKKWFPSQSDLQWMIARVKQIIGNKPEVEPEPEDPFAGVRSPKKRGPLNRSGAVAMAEPDEEDENRSFPPRNL